MILPSYLRLFFGGLLTIKGVCEYVRGCWLVMVMVKGVWW